MADLVSVQMFSGNGAGDAKAGEYFTYWIDGQVVFTDAPTNDIGYKYTYDSSTEEQTSVNTATSLGTTFIKAGQRLTISNRTVSKLAFSIKKVNSPTGNIVYKIYRVSDNSIIMEKVLGDASTLQTAYTWEEVTFDTPTLISEEVRITIEFPRRDEPVITTQAVTAILGTTATGNGNITDLGDGTVSAHGVCYNTTGSPTTADSTTDEGAAGATGAFTTSMTGLTARQKYYVRAYATSEYGTSYGGEVNFTTITGSELSGLYAVVEERFHYVDAYGVERYLLGTVVP